MFNMDPKLIWSLGFVAFVVGLCLLRPNAGRIFLGIFYLIMATGVNTVLAFTDPKSVVLMGEGSMLEIYRAFFTKVVATAPVLFILAIVLFQLTMGFLILNKHKKVKTGFIGTIIFLILITPFGTIQLPWLGIALIQIYLLRIDFNKSFAEILNASFTKFRSKYGM